MFVHIKSGYGHGRRLTNIDFPLVDTFKIGSRGLYITVSGEGLPGYPQRNFRVVVNSKTDVEFFEPPAAVALAPSATDSVVEPNEGATASYSEESSGQSLILRGHDAIPVPLLQTSAGNFLRDDVRDDEPADVLRERMIERFDILSQLTVSVARGVLRGLVVYGGPGIGKSYEVEESLKRVNAYNKVLFKRMMEQQEAIEQGDEIVEDSIVPSLPSAPPPGYGGDFSTSDSVTGITVPQFYTYFIHKGHITASGVYAMLYNNRHRNEIIVCDDSDGMLREEETLELLKGALDTTHERYIRWTISGQRIDGIPNTFLYEGSMILITNSNFEMLATMQTKTAPHISAILDRCLYLDLMVTTLREVLVRIDYVCVELGMFKRELEEDPTPFTLEELDDVVHSLLGWTHDNAGDFRSLSLRKMVHLARLRKSNDNWQRIAEVTLLRGRK